MKKNRIRLTESHLHNIIKESVKRVLKETRFDYIDLDPYEYDKMIDNDYRSRAERAYDEIMNGVYDDKVPQWASGERDVYYDLDLDIDLGGEGIQDAVNDRNFVIDKSSALKYGQNPSDYPSSKKWHETNYPKDGNPNIKNRRNTSDVLSDEYWEDKEMRDTAKKYPHSFKKNGVMRNYDYDKGRIINFNKFRDNLEKDVYGTDQADKRPLHRKGSLNRALDESIRRAIRKALR